MREKTRLRGASALALLLVVAVWPASADAQIFGRGARTEFISGFGIRTFASFLELNDLLAAGSKVDDPARRSVSVRAHARPPGYACHESL